MFQIEIRMTNGDTVKADNFDEAELDRLVSQDVKWINLNKKVLIRAENISTIKKVE